MGSINMALRSPKTPLTAIPTKRKGSVSNHTIGYNTKASSAIGQHKKNRMIHKKKAAIATSLLAGTEFSLRVGPLSAARHSILRDYARKGFLDHILIEPKALGDGSGHFRIEPHVGILNLGVNDSPQGMNHS